MLNKNCFITAQCRYGQYKKAKRSDLFLLSAGRKKNLFMNSYEMNSVSEKTAI